MPTPRRRRPTRKVRLLNQSIEAITPTQNLAMDPPQTPPQAEETNNETNLTGDVVNRTDASFGHGEDVPEEDTHETTAQETTDLRDDVCDYDQWGSDGDHNEMMYSSLSDIEETEEEEEGIAVGVGALAAEDVEEKACNTAEEANEGGIVMAATTAPVGESSIDVSVKATGPKVPDSTNATSPTTTTADVITAGDIPTANVDLREIYNERSPEGPADAAHNANLTILSTTKGEAPDGQQAAARDSVTGAAIGQMVTGGVTTGASDRNTDRTEESAATISTMNIQDATNDGNNRLCDLDATDLAEEEQLMTVEKVASGGDVTAVVASTKHQNDRTILQGEETQMKEASFDVHDNGDCRDPAADTNSGIDYADNEAEEPGQDRRTEIQMHVIDLDNENDHQLEKDHGDVRKDTLEDDEDAWSDDVNPALNETTDTEGTDDVDIENDGGRDDKLKKVKGKADLSDTMKNQQQHWWGEGLKSLDAIIRATSRHWKYVLIGTLTVIIIIIASLYSKKEGNRNSSADQGAPATSGTSSTTVSGGTGGSDSGIDQQSPIDGSKTGSEADETVDTETPDDSLIIGATLSAADQLTAFAIRDGILEAMGDGAAYVIGDITTPQGQAMRWLTSEEQLPFSLNDDDVTTVSTSRATQRYSVAVLFYSLGGDQWKTTTVAQDGTDGNEWLSATDHCEWAGMECDTDYGTSVTSIILPSNNLVGEIPPEIAMFSSLITLDLSDNYVSGHLPEELFSQSTLQNIDVSNNEITGALSTNIGLLLDLRSLRIGSNQMSGPLPSTLGDLTELRYLIANGNNFDNTIPDELSMLRRLFYLDLSNNNFFGPLPTLQNANILRMLYLDHNQFTGEIHDTYEELGNNRGLYVIDLSDNNLVGTVPSFENHGRLVTLTLQNNKLTGPMPEGICDLSVFGGQDDDGAYIRGKNLVQLEADCGICTCETLCTPCATGGDDQS